MDGLNTKEEKKQLLENLKEKFCENSKQYKSNLYDEANTRADFIDQFFMLLDWDMYNTNSYAEQYREVVREDKVRINGGQKAPDYSFRIGDTRKFFVEAKKPAINEKMLQTLLFKCVVMVIVQSCPFQYSLTLKSLLSMTQESSLAKLTTQVLLAFFIADTKIT